MDLNEEVPTFKPFQEFVSGLQKSERIKIAKLLIENLFINNNEKILINASSENEIQACNLFLSATRSIINTIPLLADREALSLLAKKKMTTEHFFKAKKQIEKELMLSFRKEIVDLIEKLIPPNYLEADNKKRKSKIKISCEEIPICDKNNEP